MKRVLQRHIGLWAPGFLAAFVACSSSSKNDTQTDGGGGSGGSGNVAGADGGAVGGTGAGGCTPADASSAFPSMPVLDDFNRPDGAVGGDWAANDATNAFSIQNQRLVKNTDAVVAQAMLWPQVFGADQEAFVTLSDVNIAFAEMQLTLKAQNPSDSCSSISVLYAPDEGQAQVWVCDTGWVMKGAKPMLFLAGDQLGARAYANGMVEVFKNGQPIAEYSVASWAGSSQGGYIGLSADIHGMVESYDDFGGGSLNCD